MLTYYYPRADEAPTPGVGVAGSGDDGERDAGLFALVLHGDQQGQGAWLVLVVVEHRIGPLMFMRQPE